MKALRALLDKQAHLFEKGGKLEKLYPLWEAQDTILYTPGYVTEGDTHVRDGIDQKRTMITVVVALIPCILWAMFNTGYQAATLIAAGGAPLDDWQHALYQSLGFGYDPANWLACGILGAFYFLPVLAVTGIFGGIAEVTFAIIRKHEVNEGFLVTLFLYPLTLPAGIPLWQVALGILFGVVLGKEIFGGTGMNFLNPALVARAFLFFAYPAQISGDVWIPAAPPDGRTSATWLARLAEDGTGYPDATWMDAFLGFIPGSMGETSALACLLGAVLLLITQVASWRVMLGTLVGTFAMSILLNAVGSDTNPMMNVSFLDHIVLGGFAFAMVFMATDPVSSAFTETGKLIYGFFIGVMGILVRCLNPAYPEGWMLAILFMNLFAPLIDHYVVQANVKRRAKLYGRA